MTRRNDRRWKVIVHKESGDYRCVPENEPCPPDWKATGSCGSKQECLEYLQFWTYQRKPDGPSQGIAFYTDIQQIDELIKDPADQRAAFRELECIWAIKSDGAFFAPGDDTHFADKDRESLMKGRGRFLWNDFQKRTGYWERLTKIQTIDEIESALASSLAEREALGLPDRKKMQRAFRVRSVFGADCGVAMMMDDARIDDELWKHYESRKAENEFNQYFAVGDGRPFYRMCVKAYRKENGLAEPWTDASQRGDELLAQLRYREAIEAYSEAIESRPLSGYYAYGYFQLGRIYAELGSHVEARDAFMRAVGLCPYYAEVFVNLAGIYDELGEYAKAIEVYKLALFIKPNLAMVYANLGGIYRSLNMAADCIAASEKAIQLDDSNVAARINLGLAYVESGELEAAIVPFEKVIDLKRDATIAYDQLSLVLAQLERYDEALRVAKLAIKAKSASALTYDTMGVVFHSLGRKPEALRAFQKEAQLDPDSISAHNNLLLVSEQLGKPRTEMIATLENLVRLDPDNPEFRYKLGLAHSDSGNYDEAIDELGQVEGEDGYALANMGVAYVKQGLNHEALECFIKAVMLEPDVFQIHVNLAVTYRKLGEFEKAAAACERAVNAGRWSAEQLYTLAKICLNVDRPAKALNVINKAFKMDPDDIDVQILRDQATRLVSRSRARKHSAK
jgi:tetratricopeptide (TPR) repeat protein/uncharacterized protein YbdZ (MbtH family)